MSDIKNVSLKFPCPQTRSTLTKCGENYCCEGCHKEVIDFTNKTLEDLGKLRHEKSTPICGIFSRNQLNQNFLKIAASTIIMGSSLGTKTIAQNNPNKDPSIKSCDELEIEVDELLGDIIFEEDINYSTFAKLKIPIADFYSQIDSEIQVPGNLKQNIRVFIKLGIDSTGKVNNYEIIKGYSTEVDTEAIRVLKKLDFPFEPAEKNDKPVPSELVMPILFKVEEN